MSGAARFIDNAGFDSEITSIDFMIECYIFKLSYNLVVTMENLYG